MNRIFAVFGMSLALVGSSRADTIHKRDGGKVDGDILLGESSSAELVIKSKFGTIRIPRDQVAEITYDAAQDEDYATRLKNTPNTADGQMELAIWCVENDLEDKYELHLAKVLELDPDHEEARQRLGYQKRNGRWVTRDEAMAADGYVLYKGRWMLPQEREQAEAKRDEADRRRELGRIIRLAQKAYRQKDKPEVREQAEKDMLAIDEPVAVSLLMVQWGKKGKDDERELLARVLGGIDGPESTAALVQLALGDKVVEVRKASVGAIVPRKSPPLLLQLARELRHKENDHVRRSASILAEIGDSSVVPALVDALVTEHRKVYEPTFQDRLQTMGSHKVRATETIILPDGTMVRRNNLNRLNGNSIVTPPDPQPTVIVEVHKNSEVLEALKKLTKQDLGYDESAWRKWLATEYRDEAAKVRK